MVVEIFLFLHPKFPWLRLRYDLELRKKLETRHPPSLRSFRRRQGYGGRDGGTGLVSYFYELLRLYPLRFQISVQRRGNGNAAIGLLIGFDQGDEQTREGGAAAVQDVGKFVFAGLAFETEVHAAGLEVFAIRDARHFEIAPLPRRPDFDIVGLGAGKPISPVQSSTTR